MLIHVKHPSVGPIVWCVCRCSHLCRRDGCVRFRASHYGKHQLLYELCAVWLCPGTWSGPVSAAWQTGVPWQQISLVPIEIMRADLQVNVCLCVRACPDGRLEGGLHNPPEIRDLLISLLQRPLPLLPASSTLLLPGLFIVACVFGTALC